MSHDLIIDTPGLQELKRRYGYGLATLVMWIVWLYLWLPLVSLLAWIAGVELFYEHMIKLGGYQGLLAQLHWYIMAVIGISVLWVYWVEFNRRRFQGRDRRNRVAQVSNLYDEATFFDVEPEQILEARRARTIHVHFIDQLPEEQRRNPPRSTPELVHLLLPPGEAQGFIEPGSSPLARLVRGRRAGARGEAQAIETPARRTVAGGDRRTDTAERSQS